MSATGKFHRNRLPIHVDSVRMGDFRELLFGTGQSWPRHGNYETGKSLKPHPLWWRSVRRCVRQPERRRQTLSPVKFGLESSYTLVS